MSQSGLAESLLGGVQADLKKVLTELVRYLVPNSKFGPPDHQTKSENFQAYYVESTTAASSNVEFSIVHGMGRIPYLAVPVLRLDDTTAQFVPLQVTRAADVNRVYVKSTSTSAVITLLLE